MTSIEIMARRLRVFELYSQGLSPNDIFTNFIEPEFGCSRPTFNRDYRSMDKWLPELTKLKGDADAAGAKLLGRLEIAQQRLLQLSMTAESGSARVGAAKGLVEAAMSEAKLRVDTGQLRQEPTKFVHEVEGIELKGLDEDAVGAIVQNFMDDEARRLRQAEPDTLQGPEERPEDGVDPQG